MIKTMSFATVHFTVAFAVAYVMTGSWLVGGAIAMVEPIVNTIAYYFHESAWKRLEHRRSANGYRQHRGGPTVQATA